MALHPAERVRCSPGKAADELGPIQRALQENEDWYRDLVDHSQDLLCIHDLQGRIRELEKFVERSVILTHGTVAVTAEGIRISQRT